VKAFHFVLLSDAQEFSLEVPQNLAAFKGRRKKIFARTGCGEEIRKIFTPNPRVISI